MTIALGRRRLILSLIVAPAQAKGGKDFDLPVAQNASDGELAHLRSLSGALENRRRWEADAILYGGMRMR